MNTAHPRNTHRRWLVAGGAAALAAGVGFGAWRAGGGGGDDPFAAFWAESFEAPDGSRLLMADFKARPLVLNFWATWCPPCVREMPVLDRFQRDYAAKGWRVLGLAADNADPVREFLARQPVSFPIALAGFAGVEWSRRLGNVSGGLPFTLVFGRGARLAHRHIGETRREQLVAWAEGIS